MKMDFLSRDVSTRLTKDDEPNTASIAPFMFPDMIGDRRRDILMAAATLFTSRGFKGTSTRDIAESVGILAGSLYHHFRSKEELFLEVHKEALRVAGSFIDDAVSHETEPDHRLRAACRTHLEIYLHPKSLKMPMMEDLVHVSEPLGRSLIAHRDAFEERFRTLVDALSLPDGISRKIFRLTLLTLLNNVVLWYRPGQLSPSDIADHIMAIYLPSARNARGEVSVR